MTASPPKPPTHDPQNSCSTPAVTPRLKRSSAPPHGLTSHARPPPPLPNPTYTCPRSPLSARSPASQPRDSGGPHPGTGTSDLTFHVWQVKSATKGTSTSDLQTRPSEVEGVPSSAKSSQIKSCSSSSAEEGVQLSRGTRMARAALAPPRRGSRQWPPRSQSPPGGPDTWQQGKYGEEGKATGRVVRRARHVAARDVW